MGRLWVLLHGQTSPYKPWWQACGLLRARAQKHGIRESKEQHYPGSLIFGHMKPCAWGRGPTGHKPPTLNHQNQDLDRVKCANKYN